MWIYQQQRIYLTENSMLCYGPLVSELGGGECMVPQPRHWGACAPPGSATYVTHAFQLAETKIQTVWQVSWQRSAIALYNVGLFPYTISAQTGQTKGLGKGPADPALSLQCFDAVGWVAGRASGL